MTKQNSQPKGLALIVGVGEGLSASLARLLHKQGYQIALAARNITKMDRLTEQTGATVHRCDASDPADVNALFTAISEQSSRTSKRLDVAIYNPSARVRGPLAELDPAAVKQAIEITAFGAFLVGQQATRLMLKQAEQNGTRGTILFTGASAGVKGFAQSATFAMGKFAQRGLAESMSRELHPQGIHVAWINIDGGIRNPGTTEPAAKPDSMLDPDEIAQSYLDLINQQRSAWSNELAVRPWVERF